ncbi:hypothetical protein CVT24_010505 [Panaeolus cyanescens]|uniref:Arrestin-like N-terminal domain-containing protein n=1 Tax=Panaeolus cyanescens TaxID=181874 RepID=A0A409YLW6_9AGAR|nr:hypothetical protein CVT24_010505 [Panaeolus cyanescens]
MTAIPSTDSSEPLARWSRIVQRSSAFLGTRRWSTATTNTVLPAYSEMDPRGQSESCSSMSLNESTPQTSPTEPDLPLLPPYYVEQRDVKQGKTPIVLRSSVASTLKLGLGEPSEVYTHSAPLRGNSPWVTLHMYTPKDNRVSHRPSLPIAYGGETFSGIVELDIVKPIFIQDIKLTIKGKIILGASTDSSFSFLTHTVVLWSSLQDTNASINHSKGKFSGYQAYPFSFTFPTEVNASSEILAPLFERDGGVIPFSLTGNSSTDPIRGPVDDDEQESQRINRFGTSLPPSFLERDVSMTVKYEIHLQISHGRFRSETKVISPLIFVPCVTPSPLPPGLRSAYETTHSEPHDDEEQGVIIPSPLADPASWFALPSNTLNGFIPDMKKPISVHCILYITRPLSYTRSTVIPCFLSISGDDSRVLDTLSTPGSPRIRLIRKIGHPTQTMCQYNSARLEYGEAHGLTSVNYIPPQETKYITKTREVGRALWWKPPKDVEQHSFTRYMAGEIHLAESLLPSSSCGFLKIDYFIELLPFHAPSFRFEGGRSTVLASQLIEIASTHARDGPIPIPFIRPPRATSDNASVPHNPHPLTRSASRRKANAMATQT